MAFLITLLIFVVAILLYMCYDRYKKKDIFEKVKWCVSYNPHSLLCVRPELKQRDYIIHLQTEMALEETYRILESDFDIVYEILKSYQQDLLRRYFEGYALNYSKLSEEDYFIVTFWDFLQRQQSEGAFIDCAVTYQKLSYISHLSSQKIYKNKHKKGRG